MGKSGLPNGINVPYQSVFYLLHFRCSILFDGYNCCISCLSLNSTYIIQLYFENRLLIIIYFNLKLSPYTRHAHSSSRIRRRQSDELTPLPVRLYMECLFTGNRYICAQFQFDFRPGKYISLNFYYTPTFLLTHK